MQKPDYNCGTAGRNLLSYIISFLSFLDNDVAKTLQAAAALRRSGNRGKHEKENKPQKRKREEGNAALSVEYEPDLLFPAGEYAVFFCRGGLCMPGGIF